MGARESSRSFGTLLAVTTDTLHVRNSTMGYVTGSLDEQYLCRARAVVHRWMGFLLNRSVEMLLAHDSSVQHNFRCWIGSY